MVVDRVGDVSGGRLVVGDVDLVLYTEFQRSDEAAGEIPFEVARVEYRGDLLKFDLEVSPDDRRSIQAVWGLTEQGNGVVARPAATAR